jgi:CRP/FNR family transcriptional regulator
MSESMRERGYSRHAFQLRMSRSDIGSYLDTTLETVSRCLSQFARQGFIAVHNRHIELLDAERLRACYANAAEG